MNTAIAEKQTAAPLRPMETFRQQLEQRLSTFAEALPPHITVQRFKSVIMQAVTADPGLLAADRVSLFEACLAAANDGLLPDKKQAALVIYNTKVKEDGKEFWIKKVQYMPMIRGIFDKVYNSGQVKTIKVAVVYAGDHFRSWTNDDGDHIEYEEGDQQDRNIVRAAFAQVIMREGGVFIEVMRSSDIEKIRSKSKTANSGPWVDWWEEMAKKSVFRRLAKRLPMARDLDAVTSRDDVFDQFADDHQLVEHQRRAPMPPRPPSTMLGAPVSRPVPMTMGTTEKEPITEEVDPVTGDATKARPKKKASAKDAAPQDQSFDPDTGEITETESGSEAAPADAAGASPQEPISSKAGATLFDAGGGGTSPSTVADLRKEAIARYLRIVSDKSLAQIERLQEIDLLTPNYEDRLPAAFLAACVQIAVDVAKEKIKPGTAREKMEALP